MSSKNLFDLTGQVALVTGGATGIGKAIADALLQHGARVLVGSRTMGKVEAAVKELAAKHRRDDGETAVGGVALDVTNDSSVERATRKAVDLFGRLDILVNSAGIILRAPIAELPPTDFNTLFDTHVTGSLRCAQSAGRLMREQHSGSIINIASVGSFVDNIGVAAYASAKSAILGLTRSLANEWAPHGIRANAIAPGFIPTDLNRQMIEKTDRGRRILEHTPMGRFGEAREVAGAAVFLAGPAASFITGQTLVVDGGFLAAGITDATAPWADK